MSKGVKICIAVLIAVFALSVSAVFMGSRKKSDGCTVQILQDNKLIYTINPAEEVSERTFRIETDGGGWNDIKISGGKICVEDADCPDKNCCKMGYLDSLYSPIVCLPHRLVIKYSDENEN